jgi:hypothetical protein
MVSPSREKHCAHTISEKQPTIHLARTRATGDPGCPSEGIGSRVKPIGRMQLLPPDSSPVLLAALALAAVAAAADAKNGSPAAAESENNFRHGNPSVASQATAND